MIEGRGGSGGGGGSSLDPALLAGYATQAWTEENYISKTFFNELFIIHKKVTTVVMDGETEISRTVTTNSIFAPNEIPGTTTETDEETGYVTTVTTEISSIESKKGFWTNYFISALGLNSEGGGGGLTLNEPLATINVSGLANHPSSSGQTIVWNGSAWTYGTAGGSGMTYTFATGDANGQFKVTPSSGAAYNVDIKGLAALAYKASLAVSDIPDLSGMYLPLAGGTVTGAVALNGGITPIVSGNVQTHGANGKLLVKAASVSADNTPNNGIVLEYGGSSTWVGQLYMADNGSDGIYWGGWYNGERSEWKRVLDSSNYTNYTYSKAQIDTELSKKLDVAFFDALFQAYAGSTKVIPNASTSSVDNIKAMFGFWTQQYISALGKNDSQGVVSALPDLVDVNIVNPTNGQVLKYNSSTGKWYNGNDEGVSSVSWSNVTDKPTTIAGYGIIDAKIVNGTITLGSTSITPLTSSAITDMATKTWVGNNYLPLTGGGLTGNLHIKNQCDLTKEDNGVTTTQWPGFRVLDKDGRISVQFTNGVYPNGNNYIWMGLRQYNTGGDTIADSGIGLIVTKSGAATWQVSYPSEFRTAIDALSKTEINSYTWWGRALSNGVVNGDMTNVGNISFSASGKNIGGLMSFITAGNGTVGVGTLSPNTNYKLDVNGYTKTSRLYLSDTIYMVVQNDGIHIVGGGLYADTYVSALGLNDSQGVVSALSDLSDVTITSPSNGQALIYDGGIWKNGAAGMNMSELTTYLSTKILTVKNGTATLGTWNPTAAGTIDIASAVSGYLPLSGGTLTGNLNFSHSGSVKLTLRADGEGGNINIVSPTSYTDEDGNQRFWEIDSYNGSLRFYTRVSGQTNVIFGTDGIIQSTGQGTLWGAYNDGVGSGLDADLLDGFHSSSFVFQYQLPVKDADQKWWHRIGNYSNANNTALVITCYAGDGWNSSADQNEIIQIFLKKGWQKDPSATNSIGCQVFRYNWNKLGADGVDVVIVSDSPTSGSVWLYQNAGYVSGRYTISGDWTWEHNNGTSDDTQTKPSGNNSGINKKLIASTLDNVASATKLHTTRYIWGNAFDGTADINGNLVMPNNGAIMIKDTNGVGQNVLTYNSSNDVVIGWDVRATSDTYITGNTINIARNGGTPAIYVNTSNNVGIGGTAGDSTYKLTVAGAAKVNELWIGNIRITASAEGIHIANGGLSANTYVSALGVGDQGGGGGADLETVWASMAENDSSHYIHISHIQSALSSYLSSNNYITSSSITDMATRTWVGQQGYITSSALTGYATQQWVRNQGYVTNAGVTSVELSVPTGFTVTGSPITNSGTIALDFANGYSLPTNAKQSNWDTAYADHHTHSNMSFLNSLTSISGTFWGRSWTNGGTVSGNMENVGTIYMTGHLIMDAGSDGIYLNNDGTGIDWHNSSNQYVSSLLSFTQTRVHVSASGGLRIGDGLLVWDSTNKAIKVQRISGNDVVAGDLYATGGLSALGMSAGVTSLDEMTFGYLRVNNTLTFGNNYASLYMDDFFYIDSSVNISVNGVECEDSNAHVKRLYLDVSRYIYVSSGKLYYYNGSSAKEIAFTN